MARTSKSGLVPRRDSPVWHVGFRDSRGRRIRASTGETSETKARGVLFKLMQEAGVAQSPAANMHPTVGQLLDLIEPHYRRRNDSASWDDFARPIVKNHLGYAFGALRADRLTTPDIRSQMDIWLENGVKPATINRRLSLLRLAFTLPMKQTPPMVGHRPHWETLSEDNIRLGFVESDQHAALRDALLPSLRIPYLIGYYSGCRLGEILALQWTQYEASEQVIRLDPGTTKNDQGRLLPLTSELSLATEQQKQLRDEQFVECPWICFWHTTFRRSVAGTQVRSARESWATACSVAGLPGLLFHDLRRTAVRNMVRAGVPEVVAMRISGHKPCSVFDRYNVVSVADLREAATKLDSYLAECDQTVTNATKSEDN